MSYWYPMSGGWTLERSKIMGGVEYLADVWREEVFCKGSSGGSGGV